MQDVLSVLISNFRRALASDPSFLGVEANTDPETKTMFPVIVSCAQGDVLFAISFEEKGISLTPQSGDTRWTIPISDIFGRPN